VVAGDINDRPGSPTWQRLAERRHDVWVAVGDGDGFTFSARNPQRRIDGVFAGDGVRPRSARVIDSADVHRASDHRPVFVELELASR
jgi:endonuclease/exonuclease/phosphatase family metal-dependent hydrolase